jgi:uncharacterized protein DUF3617
MKSRYLYVCLLALAVAAPAFAQPKYPMKPGKWRITMQMEMPGMPMQMPATNQTYCITKEQLDKDPKAAIPNDKKSDCKVGDYKADGNKVTWTVSCPSQDMTGDGKLTFSEESYTGGMNMKIGEAEMSMKYTGKRLGDCDE